MLQGLRWIIVSTLLLPALLVTVALGLAFYALEDTPLVERRGDALAGGGCQR